MPEGHTVHRLARTLTSLFAGSALAVSSPQGRFAAGAALLDGATFVTAEAWGKQLFCGFGPAGCEPQRWLRVHLGLYGAWTFAGVGDDVVHAIGAPRRRIGERDSVPATDGSAADAPVTERSGHGPDGPDGDARTWRAPAPRGAVRVRLLAPDAVADLTGPTACEVITDAEKSAIEARLGPDPIRPDGGRGTLERSRDEFVARVRRSRVTVGQQLMDQAVIAGVGNIYRAEALFRAGLDPLRPGRDVPEAALAGIWDDLVVLMRDGADAGRIVTTRPGDRDGSHVPGPGRRRTRQNTDADAGAVPADEAFYVYHRDGLPCRVCGTPVLIRDLAGRNLFWCASCQAS